MNYVFTFIIYLTFCTMCHLINQGYGSFVVFVCTNKHDNDQSEHWPKGSVLYHNEQIIMTNRHFSIPTCNNNNAKVLIWPKNSYFYVCQDNILL